MSKKLHIKTWGCQMNVYDSTRMGDVLAGMGYTLADEAAGADLVILNTCHIREKASEKLFSELGRLRELQDQKAKEGSKMTLAVAGCVAQAEGAEIIRRAPYVDLVFGPQTYHQLPEMVGRAMRAGGVVNTDFPVENKFDELPETTTNTSASAFLSVQEGCDKFCTFCVVPYTRGAEMSRPVAAVLAEAKRLVASGAIELTLLGQNVNAYHGEGMDGAVWGLGRLIREVAEIPGVQRIRYTTSHPRDMDADLVAAHAEVPQLMPFLHLPVQSGSNRILTAMNRKHDRDLYFRAIETLRTARPDMAFSSDFIVGFPGETEADFADTLDLVDRVGYAQAYSFKYSPRPGTPASGSADQIAEEVKEERLARLQDVLWRQAQHFNQAKVGSRQLVLLDRLGKKPGQVLGKSPYLQSVVVEAPADWLGRVVAVDLVSATATALQGRLVA